MDFNLLKLESIKAIRGMRSQNQVSRRLGFTYNKVYRWESNSVKMTWLDFVEYCDACHSPLKKTLTKLLQYSECPKNIKNLMKHLIGNIPKDFLMERLDVSPSQLSRICQGSIVPSVEFVFHTIYITSGVLLDIIETIVPKDSYLPSFAEEITNRYNEREYYYKNPFVAVIIRCLETQRYEDLNKHDDQVLADLCGISIEEIKGFILDLKKLGLIELSDHKYKPVNKMVNTASDFEELIKMKQYWLNQQIESIDRYKKLGEYPENSIGNYLIYTTNDKAYEKVKEAYSNFRVELMRIICSDLNRGNHDKVIVWNSHLTDVISTANLDGPTEYN